VTVEVDIVVRRIALTIHAAVVVINKEAEAEKEPEVEAKTGIMTREVHKMALKGPEVQTLGERLLLKGLEVQTLG